MLSQWSEIQEKPSGQYQQAIPRKSKKSLDYFSSRHYTVYVDNEMVIVMSIHIPDTYIVLGSDLLSDRYHVFSSIVITI